MALLELVEDEDVLVGAEPVHVHRVTRRDSSARRRIEVVAIRVRRSEQGRVIVVRDRERAREVVVERDVALVVPPQRALTVQLRPRDVRLSALAEAVVGLEEAIHLAVVVFDVAAVPLVVGVRDARKLGVLPLVER